MNQCEVISIKIQTDFNDAY